MNALDMNPIAQETEVSASFKAPGSAPGVREEVAASRRRSFTAQFKRQVLAEADACTESGGVGALLRRHGLSSSHLTAWRRQAVALDPLAEENAKLQRENAKLQRENQKLLALARAERAERLLDLQKQVAELFAETVPPTDAPEPPGMRQIP